MDVSCRFPLIDPGRIEAGIDRAGRGSANPEEDLEMRTKTSGLSIRGALVMTSFVVASTFLSWPASGVPQGPKQMITASSAGSPSGDEWQEEYITAPTQPTLRGAAPAETTRATSLASLLRQLVLTLTLNRR
jgi:hypothetical protein